MVKDKYGNNLRRGARVKDLSDAEHGEGTVIGTYDKTAVIDWDSGEEESVKSSNLVVIDKSFR